MIKQKEKEFETHNTNFIGAWYLSDLSICDELIDYFNEHPDRQYKGVTSRSGERCVDESIKKSTDITLYEDLNVLPLKRYLEELRASSHNYGDKFIWSTRTAKWGLKEGINIQYYKPGDAYFKYHCERSSASSRISSRHLAFMTYLNDVTDEGGTEFFHQKLIVSPEKGLTLIWPVDWTHLHRGVPSPTQEKYIITGWFSFI